MTARGGHARGVAFGIAAVAMLAAAPARAYCRTTTVEQDASYNPVNEGGCWNKGLPLFWRNSCIGYDIQRDASKKVSYEDASNLMAIAFTRWTGATCPTTGSGRSRVSLDVRDLGPVSCARIGYEGGGRPNQNIIVFRDESWPYKKEVLALTKVQYDTTTGEIYGADMEINAIDMNPLALRDPVGGADYDFLSVVTHEAGHFLGMAHSDTEEAAMFANYRPGSTIRRTLTDDDVTGICEVYRPDGTRSVLQGKVTYNAQCDPTPRGGLARDCPDDDEGGCAIATVALLGGTTTGASFLALAAAGLLRRLGRRDRKGR